MLENIMIRQELEIG